MRVIGTAGHVDHGKSTLIAALTGIHPDRLKEEQARGMTIDLGFGSLTLPGGLEVGLVDVPGHRDFVENMLAGVAGIDACWLVVAADEGVMPQTREHLAIIDLLGIRTGVMILSKVDLVTDSDLLTLVETDLRAVARGTVLESAPIVRLSAATGQGLPDLLRLTSSILDGLPARVDLSRPRLALDRVFSLDGFGTVVTGTLAEGALAVGDVVEVLPSGLTGRVRGLQNHHRKVDLAQPGSRTAANVSGIPAEALHRGDVLIHPGDYAVTRRIDARVRILQEASSNLTHGREVKVFLGTSEAPARVRLLGAQTLEPGEEGWIQLELQAPVVCARGDAFVLRNPSPPETIAGGMVVDPHPIRRHKRRDSAVPKALQRLASGSAAEVLLETARRMGPTTSQELAHESRLTPDVAAAEMSNLLQAGRLVPLESGMPDGLVVSANLLESFKSRAQAALIEFHAKLPLRQGMPREELKAHMGLEARPFQAVATYMEARGDIVSGNSVVWLKTHRVELTAPQQMLVDTLMQKFAVSPNTPPSVKECTDLVGIELFALLSENRTLVRVSGDVVFTRTQYDGMVRTIRDALERLGQVTLADVRDSLGSSRRYVQALLEHLDSIGVTRRVGDARVLIPDPRK